MIFARNFIRCFRRKDGTMDHVLALIEDITARKQAEEALQQSHDELRAIHDQVVDGIIIVDAETWNPVRVNSAFCRMVGYSEEEAKTISPKRIHPPEVLPMVREHCESTQRGITARLDNLPFLRQDGGTNLCRCRVSVDSLQRATVLDQFLP